MRLALLAALCLSAGCSLILKGGPGGDGDGDGDGDVEDAGVACDCPATAPFCQPEGTCVAQCTDLPADLQDAACPLDGTQCEARGCVECGAHTDCISGVCDVIAGGCLSGADTLFVEKDESGDCSRESPCGAIGNALAMVNASVPSTIAVGPGTYQGEDLNINQGQTVHIIAFGVSVEGQVRLASRNDATVRVDGLRINANPAPGTGRIVFCDSDARLELNEVTIENNSRGALSAFQCAKLTMLRTRILTQVEHGVDILDSSYDISNSLFAQNGGTVNAAVKISGQGPRDGRFAFNTVADNADTTDSGASGVRCDGSVMGEFIGNIVTGNAVPASDACPFAHSIVSGWAITGVGVVTDEAHLDENQRPTEATPGLDVDALRGMLPEGSLDLSLLPRGELPDMGAFELR